MVLAWKDKVSVSPRSYSHNHIDVLIENWGRAKWRFTGFYGFPESTNIRRSWDLLRKLSAGSNTPWCVGGDFNDIVGHWEKKGGEIRPNRMIKGFCDVIKECGLYDLGFRGHRFTLPFLERVELV